jgi:glycosyltransferase involved in cell wall biosynthesis
VADLAALDNVHLLGPRPYAELPACLRGLDVALLPLRLNDYTRAMFPMKFFEYLAAGRPVVATAIDALQPFRDVAVITAPQEAAFAAGIERVLRGECPPLERRLDRARGHTYRSRTASMLAAIDALPGQP